ncbi:hypothetical protein [Chromobacterium subtsugae]|nr:hypothetical protein [Chromobacterium subtsugae]
MTPQQIVGMAARLFALWLVVISFQSLGIASFLGGGPIAALRRHCCM